jgi:hypothetical protein
MKSGQMFENRFDRLYGLAMTGMNGISEANNTTQR